MPENGIYTFSCLLIRHFYVHLFRCSHIIIILVFCKMWNKNGKVTSWNIDLSLPACFNVHIIMTHGIELCGTLFLALSRKEKTLRMKEVNDGAKKIWQWLMSKWNVLYQWIGFSSVVKFSSFRRNHIDWKFKMDTWET